MSHITQDQVLDVLRPIEDPDFKRSIVDLGFVRDIHIEPHRISLTIELTTPACPVKEQFKQAAREALLALPGIHETDIRLTAQTRAPGRLEKHADVLQGVKNVIAVASGKGGVGKSTVAVNLALALQLQGGRVGLLDCDVYGPSIPLMLGVSGPARAAGENQILPLESYGLELMSIGFLTDDDSPVIWRGPMVSGLIRQFLADVAWHDLDYLVLDLPPGTGDTALTLTQTAPISGAVIVTTPQEVALADVRRGLNMFRHVEVPVLGIVENMAYFVCPGCRERHPIFGRGGGERISRDLDVPLLASIPLEPEIVDAGDNGKPTVISAPESEAAGAFQALAATLVRKLSLLSVEPPPVQGGNIEWVNTPG